MPLISYRDLEDRYDVVIAGTGFGSMFFAHAYSDRLPRARILLIEWGPYLDSGWQIKNDANSNVTTEETYVRQPGERLWVSTIGYGGGTNCWWAQTPRMAPEDFRLQTAHGVGHDWPLSYDDLEPYYARAESIMRVAGPDDLAHVYPSSAPYPQPPHNVSTIDKAMKAATPLSHFAAPCARLRLPVAGRSVCCNTARCNLCPIGAKFTALNSFGPLIDRKNVHVLCDSRVLAVETSAGVAQGLRFGHALREDVARADLVCIGANAIQTPFILMRSGLHHPALGRYLHGKRFLQFEATLDGLDNFDGGVPISGMNTTWVSGDHRKRGGAALVYFHNVPRDGLRTEWGRWRQTLPVEVLVEELPLESNYVSDEGGDDPTVHHPSGSDYGLRGADWVVENMAELLAPLPVEEITRLPDIPDAVHIQGTCRMGDDRATSIVDGGLVHHEVRNLLVLGTSVWPSCTTANPSLTAAALSLRAAHRIQT